MLTQRFTGVILCEFKLEQFINNVWLPHDAVDTQAASDSVHWHWAPYKFFYYYYYYHINDN